jgi:putative sterol carrier protein
VVATDAGGQTATGTFTVISGNAIVGSPTEQWETVAAQETRTFSAMSVGRIDLA